MSKTRDSILSFIIQTQTKQKGVAPTYDEIAAHVGVVKSTVSYHVNKLVFDGRLLRYGSERITAAAGEWRIRTDDMVAFETEEGCIECGGDGCPECTGWDTNNEHD